MGVILYEYIRAYKGEKNARESFPGAIKIFNKVIGGACRRLTVQATQLIFQWIVLTSPQTIPFLSPPIQM